MMTIIFNSNAETHKCIFINFLQHFLLNFRFLSASTFLMLTDKEQELKTHLPLDTPTRRKSHAVRLGL